MDRSLQGSTKPLMMVLNQTFELEKKLASQPDAEHLRRHVTRIREAFSEDGLQVLSMSGPLRVGFIWEDPLGQRYDETRTELEALIAGTRTDDLVVVEVVKPIIRMVFKDEGAELPPQLVQKGVVVVESREGR